MGLTLNRLSTFHVFISATFADLVEARNALQQRVLVASPTATSLQSKAVAKRGGMAIVSLSFQRL